GFHRYSTDRQWHVPHFEKMLYDQAQLIHIYSQAAVEFDEPLFATVAAEAADYVQQDLRLPEGGFCAARDAETNAIEGLYYVWSEQELQAVLGEADGSLFRAAYGITGESPFEHGHVLRLPQSLQSLAEQQDIPIAELTGKLTGLRRQLLAVRDSRPAPMRDDKVLTDWNGMLISALVQESKFPGREADLQVAQSVAEFLWTECRTADNGLHHSWCQGKVSGEAYLDDYAWLIQALLDLHDATENDAWRNRAVELADQQIREFHDQELGRFFFTATHGEQLISRVSTGYDSVYPSGNSVTVRNLLRLTRLSGNPRYQQLAESTLKQFASTLQSAPAGCAGMALALDDLLAGTTEASPLESQSSANETRRSACTDSTILCALTSFADDRADASDDEQAGNSSQESASQESASQESASQESAVTQTTFHP
ncbi:MAG: thioredoxin domain-containing protein, partial [Planctomycetaceae bacterium]|nr:thioredoxin domain-containing protein [Planctomycetaceae bacterium]